MWASEIDVVEDGEGYSEGVEREGGTDEDVLP